jgi:hypothetical protein
VNNLKKVKNMTMNDKKIPEFKPVKKLSPFVVDHHNTRGGGKGKKSGAADNFTGVQKAAAKSSVKRVGSGDR